MKTIITFLGFLFLTHLSFSQGTPSFRIIKIFHIASPGGWDYLVANNNKLYVSHGTQVNILDETNGDSLGFIPNTNGVHGIAFDNTLKKGFTSNGRANNVFVFDLLTNQVTQTIATGENPDAILYEPFSKTIITCNGRSKDLTVIDPGTGIVIATIPVGGKPETAVSNEKGKLYVNVEDKNEIVMVDLKTNTVEAHWPLSPDEAPTGLAIDRNTKRLFAGCEKHLVVLNAENGTIVDTLPIGEGCDGVAFNNKTRTIFTSNGAGTMTVIRENTADNYTLIGNVITKRGARTIALDEKNNTLFLPTADFDSPAPATGRPRMIPGTFQVLVVQ